MIENQIYQQIIDTLAQIDDDIARLRQQHLMLRVDIQILLEKRNGIRHNNVVLRVDGPDGSGASVAVQNPQEASRLPA
jgi:KaiC/GvpD/RAD55 family RecA-like ATPase